MQDSPKPREELERARSAIGRMKSATNHTEFEDAWKEYLSRLERSWNKTQSHFSKSPKWHSWAGKYITQIRSDPLLRYLKNARGAEEHSVADITERVEGSMTLGVTGGGLHIRKLTVSGGGEVFVDAVPTTPGAKLVFGFNPEKTRLLPIVNRDVRYDVPESHLGNAVDPGDVLTIAECGLKYHSDLLDMAVTYFVR